MVHELSLATITGKRLDETPFMQVSMTWAFTCPETVHRRPCMRTEMETWLSDSRVGEASVSIVGWNAIPGNDRNAVWDVNSELLWT